MPVGQGETLNNRYRVVKLLGQGGFGAVYRAWDLNLQRPCAIKENLEIAAESQEQFQREARMLSNLTHSNLPRVTDYFIIPGSGQYLVMDFVDGQDLDDKLIKAGGALPIADAVEWAEQVCDALSYLHSQKPPIIHRDIKPKNIIIRPDGKAFLVDFGIAKVFDPNQQTTLGARAVTPGFSPVEQYGHGKTDARTDVYAMGATLYNMLTGQIPVESVNRNESPLIPPRALNPQIPPELENTVLTAMELAPSRRYQAVSEFKSALQSPHQVQIAPTAVVTPAVAPTMPAYPSQAGGVGSIGGAPPSTPGILQPAKKRSPWGMIGIIAMLLILAGAAAVYFVPKVSGGDSLPFLAGLFATETPTSTSTSTSTSTPTITFTLTSTLTSTPRPTNTPLPTNTSPPTNTLNAPTSTTRPSATSRPTNTPAPSATSGEIALLEPTKDARHVYQGGPGCGPNVVNFSISATGPIEDHLMYIFYNIQDKATGTSIGWNSGQIMQKVRGQNTWTFAFDANTMTNTLPYKEGWFLYQFILQSRGLNPDKWRTSTYSDITISTCP